MIRGSLPWRVWKCFSPDPVLAKHEYHGMGWQTLAAIELAKKDQIFLNLDKLKLIFTVKSWTQGISKRIMMSIQKFKE